jgi:hypothetical protein
MKKRDKNEGTGHKKDSRFLRFKFLTDGLGKGCE